MSLNTHALDLESTSSQYAEISDATQTGLDITGDITIECWIKPETLTTSMLVSKYQTGTNISYALYLSGANNINFDFSTTGTTGTDSSSVAHGMSTGTWYHVAATRDQSTGTVRIYKDGTELNNFSKSTSAIYSGAAAFQVGSYNTGSLYFDGIIDDVRIWDTVRSGTDITNNKSTELTGSETNLQGYWRLNNDYTDQTSNGNDLTASGSPSFVTDTPFAGTADSSPNVLFAGGGI